MDARITIEAPDNTRGAAELDRRATARSSGRRRRPSSGARCGRDPLGRLPVPDERARPGGGHALTQFEDFFYGACLRDWDEESKAMNGLLARFDAADEVRIVGAETDLTLSLRAARARRRRPREHAGRRVLLLAVEDSAEGTIFFDVPTELDVAPVQGIRLTFRRGRVEEASAEHGEDVLLAALDMDEGARFLGELGIGCNTGITQPMRNILYDEKMAGTVHLAVGASYTIVGGKNSARCTGT